MELQIYQQDILEIGSVEKTVKRYSKSNSFISSHFRKI